MRRELIAGLAISVISSSVAFVVGRETARPETRYDALVKTPDGGVLVHEQQLSSPPVTGTPWCYVVRKITVGGDIQSGKSGSMIYAMTCDEKQIFPREDRK